MFKIKQPNNPRKTKASRLSHNGPINRKKNTLSGNATELYNALPERLREKDMSTKQFKAQLKQFMKNEKLLIKH